MIMMIDSDNNNRSNDSDNDDKSYMNNKRNE